jgi:hypothetical protein
MSEKHDFKETLSYFKDGQIESDTIQFALRLAPLVEKIKDECDQLMSNAEHRKKVASMDYHESEINHQEGRWHCANDIKECITQLMKEIGNE